MYDDVSDSVRLYVRKTPYPSLTVRWARLAAVDELVSV